MTGLLAVLLLATGAAREARGDGPDPAAAATVERQAALRRADPRAQDPDAAMLKELELLQELDLIDNMELFGVDTTSR